MTLAYNKEETARVFTDIYNSSAWLNLDDELYRQTESKSGGGSTIKQTETIVKKIPLLLDIFNIKTVLDSPCGDFNWMKRVNLSGINYTGIDIVQSVIDDNNNKYSNDNIKFAILDILTNDLPQVDLILCRDCLVHFTIDGVFQAIKNFKKSGSKYLLTTTFTGNRINKLDALMGHWNPYKLTDSPFNLPEPILIINENCTEADNQYTDKSLGLW